MVLMDEVQGPTPPQLESHEDDSARAAAAATLNKAPATLTNARIQEFMRGVATQNKTR